MPAWENIQPTARLCVVCGSSFEAKRDTAKLCSALCASRARPPRTYDPDASRRQRQNRLLRPGYRELENIRANDRIRLVKEWINAYKLEHGCIDCGYRSHAVALDFDHTDGKTRNIANLKSIKAVQAEIIRHKCVVRCSNCHRVKSWETRSWEGHSSSATDS